MEAKLSVNGLLITRRSPYQNYCANQLFLKKTIKTVIIEQGISFGSYTGSGNYLQKAIRLFKLFTRNPWASIVRVYNHFQMEKWYGNKDVYEKEILGQSGLKLNSQLNVIEVDSVNGLKFFEYISEIEADIIFVFGTDIIKKNSFSNFSCPVINMHWGWSPNYRGEGIVSALAKEGPKKLGVTIHLLSDSIDGGEILCQECPAVDKTDNFYSIGLKLSKLGTTLFQKVADQFSEFGTIEAKPQNLSIGFLYSSSYLRKHPQIFQNAWKNLKSGCRKND